MKKLILPLFALAISVAACKQPSDAPAKAEAVPATIRFAMEASYPPFETMDEKNNIQGFDVDLATALCKEIGVNATFGNQSFDSLIASLKMHRIDAVISGMDITPERAKQVLFTKPYYDNSAVFILPKDKAAKLASPKGLRVGMQNGTTHQKYITEKHPEMIAVPYDTYQNAILDLNNGRLDAVFGDTAVLNELIKQNTNLVMSGEKITDKDYFGIGLGIAIRMEDQELHDKLDAALDKIKANGTYKAIYDKWFPQH